MEHLSVERTENGFNVSAEGAPHQIFLMLGVLIADICETKKISPVDLVNNLPDAVMMAVKGLRRPDKEK